MPHRITDYETGHHVKLRLRRIDWLCIVLVFVFSVLTCWQILDSLTPPAPHKADVAALRSDFERKFGTDRTTVREAYHYRQIAP